MAVQHKDIRALRAKGIIQVVWTAADIPRNDVNDKYINQTLANHSACPCYQAKGYHCKANTKSHRFVRLGNGQYCLPEESPDVCPIHNTESMMSANPYVLEYGFGKQHNPTAFSEPSTVAIKNRPAISVDNQLCSIVSDLRRTIEHKNLNDDLVSKFIKDLSEIGSEYDLKTFPVLKDTEFFQPEAKDSPRNLAEALLWKLGKWISYKNFVRYYKHANNMPAKKAVIFYSFAKHLKNSNNPIFDQHTLRSMLAIDSTLTNKERGLCENFLVKKNGKWKQSGSGPSGFQCYDLYVRFIRKMQKFNIELRVLDSLLMPLGQALKKNTKNYDEFCELCSCTHQKA